MTALISVPVVIYVARYLIESAFGYLNANIEEQLKSLKNQQDKKIEELKQKTNFYSTQALLERFDSPKLAHPPPRKKPNQQQSSSTHGPGSPAGKQAQGPADNQAQGPADKQRQSDQNFKKTLPQGASTQFTFNSPAPSTPQSSSPQTSAGTPQLQAINAVPYQPKWYDRVLDLIAGEDEYSPRARYALICSNCQNHNGLAPPGQVPEHTIYICPYCHVKNGKPQKRKDTKDSDSGKGKQLEVKPQVDKTGSGTDSQPETSTESESEVQSAESESNTESEDESGSGSRAKSSAVKQSSASSRPRHKRAKRISSKANLN